MHGNFSEKFNRECIQLFSESAIVNVFFQIVESPAGGGEIREGIEPISNSEGVIELPFVARVSLYFFYF